MANRFASILSANYLSSSTSPSFPIVNSLHQFPNKLSKRVGLFYHNKRPRRVVLGLGVTFWAQFFNMAGNFGGKSFLASARPKSEVDKILENVEWPEQFPFKEEDFQRFDESPDTVFYDAPRFVTHIDDPAIAALTKYYSQVFPPSNTPGIAILDMCSSWVSHFPAGYKQERIAGMGLNDEELKRNPVLTEYVVQDLNTNPKLPLEDNSFDVITNVVSVDYLTKPLAVFKEMNRVLKPGGLAIMRNITSIKVRRAFKKAESYCLLKVCHSHLVISNSSMMVVQVKSRTSGTHQLSLVYQCLYQLHLMCYPHLSTSLGTTKLSIPIIKRSGSSILG